MARKKPTHLTAWSYSRLQTWEMCPLKAKLKFIDKLPEPSAPALERGRKVHKDCEDYLLGKRDDPTPEINSFGKGMFDDLRALKPQVERQMALTSEWKPTSWFGEDAWLRVILDVELLYGDGTGLVIDHKTGKKYDDNVEQNELFACTMFAANSDLREVDTRLWYLDAGEETTVTYTRDQLPDLKRKWEGRARPMLGDRTFPAKPNDKCKWCPFSRSEGGPCRFG